MNFFIRLFDAKDTSADMNLFLIFVSVVSVIIMGFYFVIFAHNNLDIGTFGEAVAFPIGSGGLAAVGHGRGLRAPTTTFDPAQGG